MAPQHSLPQLILSQLRWLDRGVSQENLVSKILEILDASSIMVQHEIIACLPEIVDDKYHTRIAMALRDKLKMDSSVLPMVRSQMMTENQVSGIQTKNRSDHKTVKASQEHFMVYV